MKKNKVNSCTIKTSIGGQALIEGIMMRGPEYTAMAVRRQNGEILVDKWKSAQKPMFKTLAEIDAEKDEKTQDVNIVDASDDGKENEKDSFWLAFAKKCAKIPFLRGIFNMGFSLSLGYKCLMRATDIYIEDSPEEQLEREKREKAARESGKPIKNTSANSSAVISLIGTVLGLVLAIGLFVVVPSYVAKWTMQLCNLDYASSGYAMTTVKSAIEGLVKIIVMVLYMWSCTLMKDVKRTFMYHGAEHKTIFCYEQGLELTVDNVKKQKRLHPRCGTSFITLTVLVSIVVGIFIPGGLPTFLRAAIKILALPLTMGISYELIRLAGRHDNFVTRIISAPGMWLQNITTVEPDESMIECAIAAMNEVIPSDGSDRI